MGDRQFRRLLKALARRDACLKAVGELGLEDGSEGGFVLSVGADRKSGVEDDWVSAPGPRTSVVPADVVRRGLSDGVLKRNGRNRVVLSAKGRMSVRRDIHEATCDALDGVPAASARSERAVPHQVASAGPALPAIRPASYAQSPLAWLRMRRDKSGASFISDVEFAAGERLHRDFLSASQTPRVTLNWSPAAGGGGRSGAQDAYAELLDRAVAARRRLHCALDTVDVEIATLLVDVCCYGRKLTDAERERGWPQRSAKIALGIGLRALASHYGLSSARTRTEVSFESGEIQVRVVAG